MSIVDGTGLVTWEGGLFDPSTSDLIVRVAWAFAQLRNRGVSITLNEAGRPFGVPGDANVTDASQTASGRSTVWFQWGRYLRGETPSAADPRSGNTLASEHTKGIAIDCDCSSPADREEVFGLAGLQATILPSEPWHWAIRSDPAVDISEFAYLMHGGPNVASLDVTPIITPKPKGTKSMLLVNIHDDHTNGGGNPAKILVEDGAPDRVIPNDDVARQIAKITGQDIDHLEADFERTQWNLIADARGQAHQ